MWQMIGNDNAVTLLDLSLRNGRLAHAYLFSGPPHVGKMTLAMSLARALNCEAIERPCDKCAQCTRIMQNAHADVQVIARNGRAEIGIDSIRELQHFASLKPFEGKTRVFIVDGAEYLSHEAANCLLKTLEEPPSGVELVLLSTNERALLPTLLSRCQKICLRPVSSATVSKALAERWQVPEEQAIKLANLSEGCPGWAIAASIDPGIIENRSQRLSSLLDLSPMEISSRFVAADHLSRKFSQDREYVSVLLSLWAGWWRDLLLARAGCSNLICNVDRIQRVKDEAQQYSLKAIRLFINSLHQAKAQLEQNANPRLVMEVLMLSIPRQKEVSSS